MIDFEQELYKHFGQVKDFTLGMRIGKYFYELGKQSGSSEIPKDLEEAADEYLQKVKAGFLRTLEHPTAKDCFIAGAKWQEEHKQKDEQFPPLEGLDAIKAKYYDDGFKNGFDEGVESVKPAEWSEEDERILKGIIGKIDHDQTYGVSKDEMLNFLKKL